MSNISKYQDCPSYRILSGTAVADDSERCVDAKRAGVLTKLIDLTKEVTPLTRSQEWEYGEASDTIQLREVFAQL